MTLKRQIDHKKECDIMTEVTYTNHISVEDYNALRDSVESRTHFIYVLPCVMENR